VHVGGWWSEERQPSKERVATYLTALVYHGLHRLPRHPTDLELRPAIRR
jgi:hypothetical protein